LALSILNKVVFCIKKSPIVIDKEVILFVGLLLVIAVQNTVNSGLSQLIPLLFFIVISNQVMKKMDRMSRI